MDQNKKRAEYLTKQLTELLRELNPYKDAYDFVVEISDNLGVVIKQKSLHGFAEEKYHIPDENFNFEYNAFCIFEELSRIRYGFDISIPSHYWGK